MAGTLRIGFAIGVLLLAACSGQPATSAPTPTGGTIGATASPQPTQAPTPTATLAGATATPGGATGNECAGMPTPNASNPIPSYTTDPALEAHFPAEIDGKPVTHVSSFVWLQLACLGGQQAVDQIRGTATYSFIGLTMGTAKAEVDDAQVDLIAFRTPGGDANQIVQTFAQLAAAAGSASEIVSVVPGTAGGKTVIVATDTDGKTSYAWVTGDTLVIASDVTQSQADKVFSAVQ